MSCISTSLKVLLKTKHFCQISCLHTQTTLNQAMGLEKGKKKSVESHFYQKMNRWRNQKEFFHDIISNHILFEDDNLLVINKPNRIAMAGADYEQLPVSAVRDSGDATFSIKSIESDLQNYAKASFFKNIYSQPRLYSGPVIFAKSDKYFNKLQKYFVHSRVNRILCQKYLIICLGVPPNIEEPIDFPMEKIHRKPKDYSITVKNYNPTHESRKKKIVALITVKHNVLSKAVLGGGQVKVALLELHINLTKWNAIETYMVDNCLCPILGDHVYSSRLSTLQNKTVRLSPKQCFPDTQKLPYEVFKALKFDTERLIFRTPLHVHCQELTIPDFSATKSEKKDIVIKAPLPFFFQTSLNLLGLKMDS